MNTTLDNYQRELVVKHMPLAAKLTRKWGSGDFADSLAEAHLGLIEAARRFDPSRGLMFYTYAVYWIRAKLLSHAVRERQGQVRHITDADDRKVHFKLHKVIRQFANPNEVSDQTVADALGVKKEAVSKARNRDRWHNIALDAGTIPAALLTDEGYVPPDVTIETGQGLEQLRRAIRMAGLNRRQRQVVRLRVLSDDPLTLEEIAGKWGVSRERVRQVERKTIYLIGRSLRALLRRRPRPVGDGVKVGSRR